MELRSPFGAWLSSSRRRPNLLRHVQRARLRRPLQLLAVAGRGLVRIRVIAPGLGSRRDVLSAGVLQEPFRLVPPRRIVGMDRQQNTPALDSTLVSLGLIFRDS